MPVIDIVVDTLGYPETFGIVRWLLADGADVARGQFIVEVENDKPTFEIPADYPGRLRITRQEGRDLPVYSVIGRLEVTDAVHAEYVRRRNLCSVTLRLAPAQWETLHRARGELSVESYVHRLVEEELRRLQ